jgi:protein gp37
VRFLSVEPLLQDLGRLDLTGIHWVIVGGESGPRARPMQPQWAEGVQRQAIAQGVPFFFKQWGTYGADGVRRRKKDNGRQLDGRRWDEFPARAPA